MTHAQCPLPVYYSQPLLNVAGNSKKVPAHYKKPNVEPHATVKADCGAFLFPPPPL